jgi:hypothetical protein
MAEGFSKFARQIARNVGAKVTEYDPNAKAQRARAADRFIEAIDHQLNLFEDSNYCYVDRQKKQRKPYPWWEARNGKYLVRPRYGVQIIDPDHAIECFELDQVPAVLEELRSQAENGALDEILEKLQERQAQFAFERHRKERENRMLHEENAS